MVAVRKFSAPIVSLQCCITGLHGMELKTDRAGFGALGTHAMADGFPGVRAKRSKSGAVSFDLVETEAGHAALQ